MNFKSNDIIRPILDIKREDIEKYIVEKNIRVRIDESNETDIYRRNKIRLNLIPELKSEYNPALIDTLYNTSRIMKMDSIFMNSYAYEKFKSISKKISKDDISININLFSKNHKAIQYRIIRLAIEDIIGHLKEIEQVHIEKIIKLIEKSKTGKKVDLTNNLEAYIDYNCIQIRLKKENLKQSFNHKLSLNDINYIDELDLEINIQITNEKIKTINKKDMFIKYFDYDKIEDGLYIRLRKPGDRFKPLGMKGNKKLKDFFIDEKVSRDKREKTPLICDNKGILWVVGNRISEDYKVDSDTSKVLIISIKNRG
ncbi:MAG: tRNA lysidine(34) synthetase TilS, partial [Senegalia sp. (in: firmicutes)]